MSKTFIDVVQDSPWTGLGIRVETKNWRDTCQDQHSTRRDSSIC